MQIAPAECRYLGLFVMVEVYHSARLDCAASHELMMNAGGDGERADCCREPAEGWTREQRCESQMRMGSFGGHDQPLCRLPKRSGWTELGIYLITSDYNFFFFLRGGLRCRDCAANQHHRICDEADPAG